MQSGMESIHAFNKEMDIQRQWWRVTSESLNRIILKRNNLLSNIGTEGPTVTQNLEVITATTKNLHCPAWSQ